MLQAQSNVKHKPQRAAAIDAVGRDTRKCTHKITITQHTIELSSVQIIVQSASEHRMADVDTIKHKYMYYLMLIVKNKR